MARTTATNFSGGLQFPYATAATDVFHKEDVQTLAQAVDQHNHTTGKGLLLAAASIPTGLITSAMIADGTIASADVAAGAIVTANIGANAVSRVVYDVSAATDLWSNVSAAAGDNNFPGYPVTLTVDPDASFYMVMVAASVLWNPSVAGTSVGFDINYQNIQGARLTRFTPQSTAAQLISCSGTAIIGASGASSIQLGPYFYASTSIPSGLYLGAASAANTQYLRFTVIEFRR